VFLQNVSTTTQEDLCIYVIFMMVKSENFPRKCTTKLYNYQVLLSSPYELKYFKEYMHLMFFPQLFIMKGGLSVRRLTLLPCH
jgi:hypothetical protein